MESDSSRDSRASNSPAGGRKPYRAAGGRDQSRGFGRDRGGSAVQRSGREPGWRKEQRSGSGRGRESRSEAPGEDLRPRNEYAPQRDRIPEPTVDEDIDPGVLGKEVFASLKGLSKDNAAGVAEHLAMLLRYLELDPDLAHRHGKYAVSRGGRIDAVRELAGLAAYRAGDYAQALRDLRAAQRINGKLDFLAIIADCERGLGKPEKTIELARDYEQRPLPAEIAVELAIVTAGARADLGDAGAGIALLRRLPVNDPELSNRIAGAIAELLGEQEPAAPEITDEDDIVVHDLFPELDEQVESEDVSA